MILRTESVVIDADQDDVFQYLSDLRNVPAWATEFACSFELEGDRAKIETPHGPATMRIEAVPAAGVIDFVVSPGPGIETRFPTRVVSLPDGSTAYFFSTYLMPGQTEAEL